MLSTIVKRAAGLDVHKKIIVATVQIQINDDDVEEYTKEFSTFERSLHELVQWLKHHNIEQIVMESTGVYWKRLYALLEAAQLTALVVNARHVKQVPGRKTDVMDSQWLATLARYGLLRGSFIPAKDLRELRLLASYRMKLINQLSGEKNRLHKILDDAGIRLGSVVTDINGVSAKAIIQGLLDGKSLKELVRCVRGRLIKKIPDIELSLECQLEQRHLFLLKQIQEHIVELEKRIQTMDDYLFEAMKPYQTSWQLLQTIPGVDAISAAILIIVLGIDMERFGNQQQLSSWAGVCPGNNESAGKKKVPAFEKGINFCDKFFVNLLMPLRKQIVSSKVNIKAW
jgi:transposase